MTDNEPTPARFKSGNEFLPYHPKASHVTPAYRDGWNDCYRAAEQRPAPARSPADELHAETAEDQAEQFIQSAVDSAPEPLQRLGKFLADVLDEDHWQTAEALLLGACVAAREGAHQPHEEKELSGHQGSGALPGVAPVIGDES